MSELEIVSLSKFTLPEVWGLIVQQLVLPDGRALASVNKETYLALASFIAQQAAKFIEYHYKTKKMQMFSPREKRIFELLCFGRDAPESKHYLTEAYTGTITRELNNVSNLRHCFKYATLGGNLTHIIEINKNTKVPQRGMIYKIARGAYLTNNIEYIAKVYKIICDGKLEQEGAYWPSIISAAVRGGNIPLLQYCYDEYEPIMTALQNKALNYFFVNNIAVVKWAARFALLPPKNTRIVLLPTHSVEIIQYVIANYDIDSSRVFGHLDPLNLIDREKFVLLIKADKKPNTPLFGALKNYMRFDTDGSVVEGLLTQMRREYAEICGEIGRPDLIKLMS